MEVVYYDDSYADSGEDCEVLIGNNTIDISYKDDQGVATYKGKEIGKGHYFLQCPERNGNANLHMFPDSKHLDGHWSEDGYEGFWRILLY